MMSTKRYDVMVAKKHFFSLTRNNLCMTENSDFDKKEESNVRVRYETNLVNYH